MEHPHRILCSIEIPGCLPLSLVLNYLKGISSEWLAVDVAAGIFWWNLAEVQSYGNACPVQYLMNLQALVPFLAPTVLEGSALLTFHCGTWND
ncbi:hypothetical protein R1flu_026807 [Riccia fluitans]|uniref:Uncharacterized protein n=1 Tax=Riccia fluitans TaxID=41844 RepID=A0ABD1XHL6_9MARC